LQTMQLHSHLKANIRGFASIYNNPLLTLDMSAKTSWKDNTEKLREVPRICVEAYAYAWLGNSAAPRIMPKTQVYAWNITPRRGQASSSAQNSSLGVEHHA
ncbi:hypothetical protein PIB30_101895, partial [Stylosanthes scabra]|nr:hypothetical protein [Stylosanthes scabra]